MHCRGCARLVFDSLAIAVSASLRRPHSSLRSLFSSFSGPLTTSTHWPPRRAFSLTAHSRSDLFDYTSGRWIINDALRHAERRRVFNVDGLCQLAAESVNRSPDDIVNLTKLAEGGFNRIFLITMRDDFRMVARIPYPATVPNNFAIASEVATMDFLRSSGLPIPEVYGYSPTPDNAAETEYIFMEFVPGTELSDVWHDLGEREIISVLRELVQLESRMMSIAFPASGSLYYARDVEKLGGGPGIPLKDERFCVGPDTRLPLWYGRRSELDVDRGPYESAEAALAGAAHKELAYLKQFGRPLLPFQRVRREAYRYQEQSPSDHIENLNRYLLIASSIIPRNPALNYFCIRHPDLQQSNIIVSRSPSSDWQINYGDPVSQFMTRPSLPENLDDLNETAQSLEKELYRHRLIHYHYVKNTEEWNGAHYAALTDPVGMLRRRLFCHAGDPWEGETLSLKVALMKATENWKTLTGGDAPCPVVFDAEDIRKTMELDKVQGEADEILEACQNMIGFGPDSWVPTERYEEAVVRSKQLKQDALAAAESAEERDEIAAHWFLDDMDEEKYN